MGLLRRNKAARDPEIEYHAPERRRKLALIVGVVMAVVATFTVLGISTPAESPPATVPMRDVVAAVVDLPALTVIDATNVSVRSVPDAPYLATTFADPTALFGKITGVPVYKGQPLMASLLTNVSSTGGFTILSPYETISPDSPVWRAVSVQISKDHAVGGTVAAGQHVDLISTLMVTVMSPAPQQQGGSTPLPSGVTKPSSGSQPVQGYYSENSTKITWQDIEVLSAETDTGMYILKVDLHQAEEIAHFQQVNNGGFSMVLRPAGDDRGLDTTGYGETTNDILEKYGFRIPFIINLNRYPQPLLSEDSGVLGPDATAVPRPTLLPTPSPTPSPSPLPTAEFTPWPTKPAETPSPTLSPSPMPSPSPVPTPPPTPEPSPSPTPEPSLEALQPDGSIRHTNGPAAGGGKVNTTATGQSRGAKVAGSSTTTFGISIQNAGNAPDSYLVSAAGLAVAGYDVTYSLDGTDVTSQVVDETFTTPTVAPGETVVIDVRVTTANPSNGSKAKRLVTLTSQGDPTKQDAVSFVVRRR